MGVRDSGVRIAVDTYSQRTLGIQLGDSELLEAREAHAAGRLDDGGLKQAEDEAIRDVVRMQEEAGLQSVTDGEFRTAATREGDLSVVAVLGPLFPVVTVGLAFALLGERLTRVQAVGAAAAMIGSVLLAASR